MTSIHHRHFSWSKSWMPWQRLVKFKFNWNEWDRIVLHEQLSKHDTCIEEEEEEAVVPVGKSLRSKEARW
jgi:hypothetical protein